MKVLKVILIVLSIFTTTSNAQEFQGVATYRTHQKFDVKLDSTKMNDDMQKKIIEMMKKQFQKTYHLNFDKFSSLYQQEVELDKPQVGGGDFQVSFGGNAGSDVLYKNIRDQNYIDQKETLGKRFLIKDSISPIKWELVNETKYIGEYLCFKATYTKQIPKRNFGINDSDKDEDSNEEPEMIERVVSAWYTPQIPVSNGPAKYQGLPGLILEVNDGKLTIICSKIVINPHDKVVIEAPRKGTEVSQGEYDDIMEKKSKEMMERYAPRKGSKNGYSIEINVGG
ncbi:GLPGLI family protein [Winogradskyella epiphytica]|uniref:GLPGLI family protein n=1 Tax=Winogradskyella epiphytica TaxID=262005 RepID=A0A2V4WV49_9FLAO|nr:GLPGLI family protein [Winogradskyella epiphytica]PYE80686.1 GLPGLI family protein [Winogradskyella epiphytica]GGW67723.1 GLPGLI family protein [Winogradskyella epiphytica]